MKGYSMTHDGRVITVFSAPNYCGNVFNLGAFMRFTKVTKDGKIIVKGPQTSTKKTREVSNVPFHKTFRESMSAKEKNAAVVGGAAAAGAAAGYAAGSKKKMGGATKTKSKK